MTPKRTSRVRDPVRAVPVIRKLILIEKRRWTRIVCLKEQIAKEKATNHKKQS
jgi:hypothetical protein